MRRSAVATLLLGLALETTLGLAQAPPTPVPAPTPPPPPAVTNTIDGPDSVLAYRIVRLTVKGAFDSAIWDIEPAERADSVGVNGPDLAFTGPPGRYVCKAITIRGGSLGIVRKVVTIQPPPTPTPTPPQPDPTPTPTPSPAPQPDGRHYVVSYWWDSQAADPAVQRQQATIRGSDLADQMKATNADWFAIDIRSPAESAAVAKFRTLIDRAGGAPLLIVQAADGPLRGAVLDARKVATVAEVAAIVAKLRGGK